MPSMTANAQTFEKAFGPALSDDRIDRLAMLVGSIRNLSVNGYATMTDNGNALAVSNHYCAHCSAVNAALLGDPSIANQDGEGDCIHKRALALAIDAELAMREAEEDEHYREIEDMRAWAVGL